MKCSAGSTFWECNRSTLSAVARIWRQKLELREDTTCTRAMLYYEMRMTAREEYTRMDEISHKTLVGARASKGAKHKIPIDHWKIVRNRSEWNGITSTSNDRGLERASFQKYCGFSRKCLKIHTPRGLAMVGLREI